MIDRVFDSFLFSGSSEEFTNYRFENSQDTSYPNPGGVDKAYFVIKLQQGQQITTSTWTQMYIKDFLQAIGGLTQSIMAIATIFVVGYQSFVS